MTATEIHRISLLRTFFVSLDKSVLLHCRCLMLKFAEILILFCRKIFFVFFLILQETFSNSCDFALSSDLKNILTKHFPTMQPFANVLQNRFSYEFFRIRKKISVLESLFNKVTGLIACNFIKKQTPTQMFSCEYHKMFENSFLIKKLSLKNSTSKKIKYFLIINILQKSTNINILGHSLQGKLQTYMYIYFTNFN